MQLRYNYLLDPAPRHRIAFGKAFGCARFVFNDALAVRVAAHQARQPFVTDAQLSARLTAIKKTPERAWLTEVSSVVLQQALADLNAAYRNFFASSTSRCRSSSRSAPVWPIYFALTRLTAEEEARIVALVQRAVS